MSKRLANTAICSNRQILRMQAKIRNQLRCYCYCYLYFVKEKSARLSKYMSLVTYYYKISAVRRDSRNDRCTNFSRIRFQSNYRVFDFCKCSRPKLYYPSILINYPLIQLLIVDDAFTLRSINGQPLLPLRPTLSKIIPDTSNRNFRFQVVPWRATITRISGGK